MDKDKVIALLDEDLEGEHGAVIQYLTHAYAMGEGEMACEIEAIARGRRCATWTGWRRP